MSGSFGWYGPDVLLFKPIKPTADLAPGTQYTASVSTAAKELGGNPLTIRSPGADDGIIRLRLAAP